MRASLLAARAAAWALAPARGGSRIAPCTRPSSWGSRGRRSRSRVSTERRKPSRGRARRSRERLGELLLSLDREHLPTCSGERQAEGAAARIKIGDAAGLSQRLDHRTPEHRLALAGRLQEGARRQHRRDLAEDHAHGPALDHDFDAAALGMAPGDPCQIMRLGKAREALAALEAEGGVAQEQQVEAAVALRHQGFHACAGLEECGQKLVERRQQRHDGGSRHGAFDKRDDLVARARVEAEHEIALAAHRTELGAAPARGRGHEERADLAPLEPLAGERLGEELELPRAVMLAIEMLERAAAAAAEMAAGRVLTPRSLGKERDDAAGVTVRARLHPSGRARDRRAA